MNNEPINIENNRPKETANTQEPWWLGYRRNQNKPRKRLTLEMIIRKSLRESLKAYLQNCTLSCFNRMSDPGVDKRERVSLLLLFLGALVTLGFCMAYIWSGMSKPLIVNMESTTYPISNIDFPAVAFCNINKISLKRAIEDAEVRNKGSKFNRDKIIWRNIQAGRLIDFNYNEDFENHKYAGYLKVHDFEPTSLNEFMKWLSPNCSELMLKCQWDGNDMPCDKLFQLRRTAYGHCCTFNYILEHKSLEKPYKIINKAERQSASGVLNGLNIILDPHLEDYAYTLHHDRGFDIIMFEPTNFADLTSGRAIRRVAEPSNSYRLRMYSQKQVAAREVRKYSYSTRKCLFNNDRMADYGLAYTYSACLMKCRIETLMSLCQCIPYFMPESDSYGRRVCTLVDLKCLNKYKEKLYYFFPKDAESKAGLEQEVSNALDCPDCYPDCEHTQHTVIDSKVPMESIGIPRQKYFRRRFSHGLNMTNKCVVSIYQATPDAVLNKLDIVSYWYEILSSFGGYGGLLAGFTTAVLIDLTYFLFIRFFFILRDNYNNFK